MVIEKPTIVETMTKEDAFDMIADLTINSTVDSERFHMFVTTLLEIIDQVEV